jgi:ATP-binding cassette, subfamily B, bacterial PglK
MSMEPSLFSALKELYAQLTPRRKWQLLLLVAFMLVGAIAELATLGAVIPFLALLATPERAANYRFLGELLPRLGWQTPSDIMLPVTLLFVLIAFSAAVIRIVLNWASQKFAFRLGHDLGVEVYRRTLYQPYSYHASHNTSEIIAGIDKVNNVTGVLLQLTQISIAIILSVFIIGALVAIDPLIASIAASGFGVLYIGVSYATRRKLKSNSQIIATTLNKRVQNVQEGLGGIRDIILDHSQRVYLRKFMQADLAFRDAQAINSIIGTGPRFAIEAGGMVLIAALALMLSYQPEGLLTAVPVLGALALGAQRLLPLFQLIYLGWTQVNGNRQALTDVIALLRRPMPEEKPTRDVAAVTFMRDISLRDLSFRYLAELPDVIHQVNLTIPKGSRVGFVGKTGSGKSTILDIIMGLLEPTVGAVLIDGKPIDAHNCRAWQARIAHVPQSIYLADTTIANNIAFGVEESRIDLERVRTAARRAQIADFIEGLSEGYRTPVGERGVRLSGGQRQRIGIARALYKDADVLVFDEATSALDNETETAVMEVVNKLGANITILMIAHRLSTVRDCNILIALEHGQIVTTRSHRNTIASADSAHQTFTT